MQTRPSCLIPAFDGALYSCAWKEALWSRFFMVAPQRQRRCVERMNRTIKEATVNRFHYESHDELNSHLTSFVAAYNFAKRLKTLKSLTPYEFICKI